MVTNSIFDEPPSTLVGPRLFASQNRVWQAIAGHGMDLKKIPAMEFVLLCIIANHGSEGIIQPELVRLSKQDKRSVPKRTDNLARNGYINKTPFQSRKYYTSLCVHKRSVKQDNVLFKPHTIDEVFGEDHFILSGFIYLLHNLLVETGGVIPSREVRVRLVIHLSV
jgi:hypothetical protein